jgi:hypothetical protein
MFIDQEYKSSSELLFHLHDIILRPASSFLRSSSVTPALSLVPNTHTSLPASLWAVYLSLLRYKYKLTRVPPLRAPARFFIGVRCVAGRCGTLDFREDRCTGWRRHAAASARVREKNWAIAGEDVALPGTN